MDTIMSSEVKVKVEQGWLQGQIVELITKNGFYNSFKGIPYAAPPIGPLRFKDPRPAIPWDGIRKATEYGPISPQVDIFTKILSPGDEDCLFLNVFTPEIAPKRLLPVMVFIHGGGFKSGSGNDKYYGPDFLVQQGVVLVTINYRLEAFGFLCLDTEDVPGNAGLKDQVAALKWIQTNIKNFGGEPTNVTIFGESAGGSSVGFHILSPMSKGLFRRAISMSGVPLCEWSFPYEPVRRAFSLGKELGCHTNDPKMLLDFLQKVPTEKFVNLRTYVMTTETNLNNMLKMYCFTPVVEKQFNGIEHFITEPAEECLRKGKVNDVDVMIGFTDEECLVDIDHMISLFPSYENYIELFVPRPLLVKISPTKSLQLGEIIKTHYFGDKPITTDTIQQAMAYFNDATFIYNILSYLNLLPNNGRKRYLYEFSAISERNVYSNKAAQYGVQGASHLEDLVYLFTWSIANFPINKEAKSYKIIKQTCKLFTNFAKYGNPTPDNSLGVIWEEYKKDKKCFLDIGEELVSKQSPRQECLHFWDSIYRQTSLN